MEERISLNSKVVELNEQKSNDIYMTLKLCVLTSETNLNKAKFTESFIEEVVENKDFYTGIPLVANRKMLEDKKFDNLTHEFDTDTGELNTDIIGSFTNFYSVKEDDITKLMADVRIFKRFPNVCNSITELFQQGELSFSCECLIYEYASIEEDGTRVIDRNGGKLFASAVVTEPAEVRSKATLLIAEAYQNDLEQIAQQSTFFKGGENLGKEMKGKMEISNKGVEVKFHGNLETSSLTWDDVYEKIYNTLNPVDQENGGRNYNYYIIETYVGSIIVGDWDTDQLYRITYKIEEDSITLAPKEDWVKGSYQFVPEGVTVNELIDNNTQKIKELEKEVSELKEEKKEMADKEKLTMKELQEKVEKLKKEIADLKDENEKLEQTIVSQKENLVEAEELNTELNEKIEELKVYKEKVETAEKEAKMKELSDKYSKLLDKEVFESEKVQEAIDNLDEVALNSIVVAEIAKEKTTTTETAEEDIIVAATVQTELVDTIKDSSYWASPKA